MFPAGPTDQSCSCTAGEIRTWSTLAGAASRSSPTSSATGPSSGSRRNEPRRASHCFARPLSTCRYVWKTPNPAAAPMAHWTHIKGSLLPRIMPDWSMNATRSSLRAAAEAAVRFVQGNAVRLQQPTCFERTRYSVWCSSVHSLTKVADHAFHWPRCRGRHFRANQGHHHWRRRAYPATRAPLRAPRHHRPDGASPKLSAPHC
jgi:hypothetical protein